jgi:phosphohistidine swiveling domain-containing protein
MSIQRGLLQLVVIAKREGTVSPAFERELGQFLAENYFHADAELDISTPRWGESPERVKQIVEDILRAKSEPKDPDAAAKEQFQAFSAEQQRIIDAIRRSVWHRLRFERRFRKQLQVARTYLSRREEMREYSTRAYNLVRQYVLESGRRLQRMGYLTDSADVFMLYTNEIPRIGRGKDERERVLALTSFRRLMYRGYRLLEPPGELGKNVTQRDHTALPLSESGAMVLHGIGCSAGLIEATVRVVLTLEGADTVRAGEVLVTRFTDPGWTPVLGIVAGVVTEVGGLLSHAAVIGREYGIPAVLNVPGATQILKTGQRVRLDGREGTVTIMPSS